MNCGRLPITVKTRVVRIIPGYRGSMVVIGLVVGASRHLLWFVNWHTGGKATREAATRRQVRPAPAQRAA